MESGGVWCCLVEINGIGLSQVGSTGVQWCHMVSGGVLMFLGVGWCLVVLNGVGRSQVDTYGSSGVRRSLVVSRGVGWCPVEQD